MFAGRLLAAGALVRIGAASVTGGEGLHEALVSRPDVTAASFAYEQYVKTEIGVDSIKSLVSVDGTTFYGWGTSGDTQGWKDRSLDLSTVPTLGSVCGKSRMWIAFKFESDESEVDEGAYVDEVRLYDNTPIPVTTAGGTGTSPGSFTVTVPKPGLVRLSPPSGKHCVTVTIPGRNFGKRTSLSYVKFGAVKCSKYVSWSATRIKCKVPAKAKFGKPQVKVTTAAGTSSGRTFTVKR